MKSGLAHALMAGVVGLFLVAPHRVTAAEADISQLLLRAERALDLKEIERGVGTQLRLLH